MKTAFAQNPDPITLILENTTDTFRYSPPSSDPAGITFLPDRNRLLISDSEVNEISQIFIGFNLFEVDLCGELQSTAATLRFSSEPTGVALNPDNGHFFFSDDDAAEVIVVNPGMDQIPGNSDDIFTSFDTAIFGSGDPESIAYNSLDGHLFVIDGVAEEVFEIDPGMNGHFDGIAAHGGDDIVSSFDVETLGITDPEGIEFNAASGTLFIVASVRDGMVYEVTKTGTLLRIFDISDANPEVPAGLTLAPGSTDSGVLNLYVVDRNRDNNNDGKLYEFSLPATSLPVITAFSPRKGPELTEVTLSGSNFTGTSGVRFGSTPASFVFVSDSEIEMTVPSKAVSDQIQVTNLSGASFSPGKFIVAQSLGIQTFVPSIGGEGQHVRIVGNGFCEVLSITFNGISASEFSVDSESQIRSVVPGGATTGPIVVTTSMGATPSSSDFTVLPTSVFNPTDDSYVRSSEQNTNFGTSSSLRLKTGSSTFNTYLKFDISGVEPVHGAILRLYVTQANSDGGSLFQVSNDFDGTSIPWNENELTWNNAPGLAGDPLEEAGSVFLDTWVELDVSGAITGDGVFSFGLSSAHSQGPIYSSREGSHPPQLIMASSTFLDSDGDSVPDGSDNCPDIANQDQSNLDGDDFGDVCDNCEETPNSQVDSDVDGLGDACDNCPNHDNFDQSDMDDDGLGDVCDPCPNDAEEDVDEDGVCSGDDNCPQISNPDQDDQDLDGVGDACDNCPNLSNPVQVDADEDTVGLECDCDDGNPNLQTCNTPVSEVPVTISDPTGKVEVTFSSVSAGGTTTINLLQCNPDMFPAGEIVPTDPICHDIETTATFDGNAEVCIVYSESMIPAPLEPTLKLISCDSPGGPCEALVVSNRDMDNDILCGETNHFSIFAVISITPAEDSFIRGNCNGDGDVNIADSSCIFNFLFLSSREPGCIASLDLNSSGDINIADASFLLNFLFLGGRSPSLPYPDCGPSSRATDEELGCEFPPESCSGL